MEGRPVKKETPVAEHSLELKNREFLSLTGVERVDTFDDGQITLITSLGVLTLHGESLHIKQLDLEKGSLLVDGRFHSIVYSEKTSKRAKNLLQRLMK